MIEKNVSENSVSKQVETHCKSILKQPSGPPKLIAVVVLESIKTSRNSSQMFFKMVFRATGDCRRSYRKHQNKSVEAVIVWVLTEDFYCAQKLMYSPMLLV